MIRHSRHLLPFLALFSVALMSAVSLHAQKNKGRPKSEPSTSVPKEDPEKLRKQMEWLYMEASTQLLMENFAEAKTNFEKVLELDPKHGAAHYNLSKIELRQGSPDAARKHAEQALASDKGNYWYHVQLRETQEKQLDWKGALATQENVVTLFPKEKEAKKVLSNLYLRLDRPEDALRVLNQLEAQSTYDATLVRHKFDLLMSLRRLDEALVEVEKLHSHSPGELEYLQMKYDLLQAMGRNEEASQLLVQMQSLDPNNGFLLLTLADHYKRQGDTKTSDDYLFRAIHSPSLDITSKLQVVTGLMPYVSTDPSVKDRMLTLSRIVATDFPNDAQALGIHGDILRMCGKRDSAMIQYRRSLEVEPANRVGWQQLLSLENDLSDWQQLKKDGEKALEYFPNEPALLQFFGIGCSRTGDTDGAIYAFEKLRKMSAGNPEAQSLALLQLGQLYFDQELFDKSDEAFQSLLGAQPDNATAKNNFAYCLAQRKTRLDEAEKMSLEALQANPTSPTFQDTYGWILFQKGNYPEAQKWLEQAALGGGGAESFEHFADVLVKMGNNGKAADYYQKAKAAGADGKRIDSKLQAIQ
jgi:tetratricopeptide (TPR) repeat protein